MLRSRRTAAVLVEVVERVEARLLLLVRLERVAGLEVGLLHGRDPAGPGGTAEPSRRKHKKRARIRIAGECSRIYQE